MMSLDPSRPMANENASVSYVLSGYMHELDLDSKVKYTASDASGTYDNIETIKADNMAAFSLFVYVDGAEVYSKETDDLDLIYMSVVPAEDEVEAALTVGRINEYDQD